MAATIEYRGLKVQRERGRLVIWDNLVCDWIYLPAHVITMKDLKLYLDDEYKRIRGGE
jgi:hypothetical protein